MIREIEEKDIEQVLSLLEEVLMVHHEIRPDLFKAQGSKYNLAEIKEIMKDRDKKIFVYTEGKNVLGHIFIQLKEQPETLHEYYQKKGTSKLNKFE